MPLAAPSQHRAPSLKSWLRHALRWTLRAWSCSMQLPPWMQSATSRCVPGCMCRVTFLLQTRLLQGSLLAVFGESACQAHLCIAAFGQQSSLQPHTYVMRPGAGPGVMQARKKILQALCAQCSSMSEKHLGTALSCCSL